MLITNTLITQIYMVPEVSKKLLNFNSIRWYRSATGPGGYFEAATRTTSLPATLRTKPTSLALGGNSLALRINGIEEVVIDFPYPNPLELEDIATLIAMQAPSSLAARVEGAELVLETVLTGSGASIMVLESVAAGFLNLLPGEGAIGLAADTPLVSGISEYRFADHQSSPSHYYQVELMHSGTGLKAPRSTSFCARRLDAVSMGKLIGCFIRLCDLTGRPIAGRRVIIHNVFQPNRVEDDGVYWGMFRTYEEMITDPNGYAEITLLRGATVDVTVGGTGFTRRIVVPAQGTLIDLLDPSLSTTDEFGIRSPDIDFAIRTS